MKCPRCKTDDVYVSRSGNMNILSMLMTTVRCHRCCYLFSVPPWTKIPKKPGDPQDRGRRAA